MRYARDHPVMTATGAVGVLASAAGLWAAPASFWAWLWPTPVVIGLVILLVAQTGYSWRTSASRSYSDSDQSNLSRLLARLPRETVIEWRETDLLGGWPWFIVDDLHALVRLDEAEHHFRNRRLEKRRRALHEAASELALLDAQLGGPAKVNGAEWRDLGYSAGEFDFMQETPELQEARSHARQMEAAAEVMVQAYEDLVATARDEGYDVSAAAGDSPGRLARSQQ